MKTFKIFSDSIEQRALDQFHDAMKMDFVIHGALMPDAHAGYALPIGAVVATVGKIVPAWVGYDIGCGMCALPTSFKREDVEANKKAIFDQIYRDVPVGFNHNKTLEAWVYHGPAVSPFVKQEIIDKDAPNRQLGTLGSGNHFIEIGYDERDVVWIVIHSGSRNVGHKIATHYMKIASGDGKAREWHFGLDVNSQDGKDYINDLAFALQFALDNRRMMIHRVIAAIFRNIDHRGCYQPDMMEQLINRNHNHAEQVSTNVRFKFASPPDALVPFSDVWIHRKGATHAKEGMLGVIPGNMRDGSFIVRGKGNPEALWSSSHGAGRVMGRKEAQSKLDMSAFIATMQERGIQALVNESTLDESPDAYKSIFHVMAEQSELVEVLHHIKPIINIKG